MLSHNCSLTFDQTKGGEMQTTLRKIIQVRWLFPLPGGESSAVSFADQRAVITIKVFPRAAGLLRCESL